ncbi:putative bifunctional diguanylate cyclase/phosphodiesterase [Azonexus sp.]|uniref:putative bifunctional diguanylate cyclase/phosphodiesterase n=1 Tax=Azonexus sp. TaxID=1872668 RepID=UPI0039E5B200
MLHRNTPTTLRFPGLTLGLLGTTLAAFVFWHWQPGSFSAGLLILSGLALLAVVYAEYRHFHSISQAYHLAMQAAHDGFWAWNPVSKELQAGQRLLEILGYERNFLPDTHAWLRLLHPDDVAAYNQAVAQHLKGENPHFYCEYRVLGHNGSYYWVASRGLAVRNRKGIAYLMVGSITDITERRRHQEILEHQARHDPLTGLPNRSAFAEDLQVALQRTAQAEGQLAVLFIDLDRFKNINDSQGHGAGDQMLHAVAQAFSAVLPADSRLYRQGGDEFIVLQEPSSAEAAEALAQQLKARLNTPLRADNPSFMSTASIGISLFPSDAGDGETLLRHADTAMYAAKAAGGNTACFHTPQMDARLIQRISLESRLRAALLGNCFALYFQPQIRLADGCLVGAEALIRWHDGEEMVPPDLFIPVAEECGLIVEVGDWVISEALRQICAWRAKFPALVPIAINLSPRQFRHDAIAQRICQALADAALPAHCLKVEVTESIALDPEGDGVEQLQALHAAGIGIALDDFGTGYSSLSLLQSLPVSTLKIDRSFVRDLLAPNSSNEPLIRAMIAMAHSLSLQVVAEGVETEAQAAHLKNLGCDIMQGYLCSRPLPAAQFEQAFLQTET